MDESVQVITAPELSLAKDLLTRLQTPPTSRNGDRTSAASEQPSAFPAKGQSPGVNSHVGGGRRSSSPMRARQFSTPGSQGGEGRPRTAFAVQQGETSSQKGGRKAGTRAQGEYPLVSIPAGRFTMGCSTGQSGCDSDEKPARQMQMSGFYIGEKEVTQGLYRSVVGANPSRYAQCGDNCPVESVSWFDAVKFANALSRREGLEPCYQISGESVSWPKGLKCQGYRLPTEAEWEYAARAGEDTLYPGSNYVKSIAWYSGNSLGYTHPVGEREPNDWGIYDAAGNVCEWVWDWYGSYANSAGGSPAGPTSGKKRVYRGGGKTAIEDELRVSVRWGKYPSDQGDYLGFRLSRSSASVYP